MQPLKKDRDERRGFGFWPWWRGVFSSPVVQIGVITAAFTISVLHWVVPKPEPVVVEAPRAVPIRGQDRPARALPEGVSPVAESPPSAPNPSLNERPDKDVPVLRNGALRPAEPDPEEVARKLSAGLALSVQEQRSLARWERRSGRRYSRVQNRAPQSAAQAGGDVIGGAPVGAGTGVSGKRLRARVGKGTRSMQSIQGGWRFKKGGPGAPLKLGKSAALARLKGIDATMKANRGRKVESIAGQHKKEWEAYRGHDRALATKTSAATSLRSETVGEGRYNPVRPEYDPDFQPDMIDTALGDGGPIVSAQSAPSRPASGTFGTQTAASTTHDASEQSQLLLDAASGLLPLASLLLMSSYRLATRPSADKAAKLAAAGALTASGLAVAAGAAELVNGDLIHGGMTAGVGILMTNLSGAAVTASPKS